MRYAVVLIAGVALAGCAGQRENFLSGLRGERTPEPVAATAPAADPVEGEVPQSEGNPFATAIEQPAADARTVEQFDTTTEEQRAAAVTEAPVASAGPLGTTIASLGDPNEPGFWIKTPLVSAPASGRLLYVTSGRSVQVDLIPSGAAPGSGSQVSLAAMRLLDAPLAGLPELEVYVN
ncbi:MAG: hypothetical protein QNJ16_03380 [Rhodobacter sp.]|nr:hypothetical protein [Rhodobacter sp.]